MKKYCVVGGQYVRYFYGDSDSLHGAKLIATANKEYWDNWQGWHVPRIFNSGDCNEKGIPVGDVMPVAVCNGGKWVSCEW